VVDLLESDSRSEYSRPEQFARIDQALLDAIPWAAYFCSADGIVRLFNQNAVLLWGRKPRAGEHDERFCGAWRLYRPNGTPLAHDSTPMEEALRTGVAQHDKEVILERPDGSRIVALVNIQPLKDSRGRILGAINCFYDITERKKAEAEQRRQTQLFVSIVESSDDAILSKDLNGTILSWNRGAERLFGYTAKEAVGNSIEMIISSDQPAEEAEILRRIRRGARIEQHETVRRHKDGRFLDVSLTVSPVTDEEGRIIGASSIARDISARKRIETQLTRRITQQSGLFGFTARLQRAESLQEVYDAALDTIGAIFGCQRSAILLFDKSNVMRFVAWRGLSDSYRGHVEGHSPWSPRPKDPSPVCITDVARSDFPSPLKAAVQDEGICALAFIPIMADGKLIGKFMTYYEAAHDFQREEIELSLTIAHQLGFSILRMRADEARREAEEALRDSERRLEFALSAGEMGAWEWNIGTGEIVWSPGLEILHGLKPGSFGGRIEDFERDIHQDDREQVQAEIDRTLTSGDDYHVTYRMVRPDQTVRWIEAFGRLVPGIDGKPSKLAGICMDVTERKENELQRELMVAELSHRVRNTLATVTSIEQQSFLRAPSIIEGRRAFTERVRALAQSHGRLAEGNWSGVSLESILREELEPYRQRDRQNFQLAGPHIMLKPKCALTLGMAIHELTTNAAKYGALSCDAGFVEIEWTLDRNSDELMLIWVESKGPAVRIPTRCGFGRLLLERALAADLKGQVLLDFAISGLRCTVTLPLADNVGRLG
jgi:PAS domain S-box-containing protein